ncbi:MAG: hypothetical protein KKG76_00480 [Euryarchaeota archaeon]|nr:hypothetical protein [Euryarchaeota archaeon]
MKGFITFFVIALLVGAGEGGNLWANNITINEYDMIWSYDETITGADSIAFRINIDSGFGDNDSFVNTWEVLLADKELRKEFRSSIYKELDVRINNKTDGIYLVDVDAMLSPDVIGKTHILDTVVNTYTTTYRFDTSVLNAGSIWFMGQAGTPVTIVMPQGVDVTNISGIDNATINITDHAEISGFFREISKDRGEITLTLSRNTSFIKKEINASNVTSPEKTDETKPVVEMLSWIRDASIVVVGLVIILLIYVFRIRKK